MLKKLSYKATFPSTGRTLEESINFQTGFGTITGPNESGKSFSIEMIRWALFGSSALRGTQSELRNTRAELEFVVKGETYKVERTLSNATLSKDGVALATGTSPVNAKVAQVLGFGLKVFDVACVANQGDLEALGSMRPTERKKMVDSVIGLEIIEQMAKWAAGEAKGLNDRVKDLKSSLVEPSAPEKPAGYTDAAILTAEVARLEAIKAEYHKWLGRVKTPPAVPDIPLEKIPALKEAQAQVANLIFELRSLPEPSPFTEEELADEAVLNERHRLWSKRPELTLEEIEEQRSFHAAEAHNLARSKLENHIQRLKDGQTECPSCQHRWSNSDTKLAEMVAELDAMGPARDVGEVKFSSSSLTNMEKAWAQLPPNLIQPERSTTLSDADIEMHRKRNWTADRWRELTAMDLRADPADYRKMEADWATIAEQAEVALKVAELAPQTEGLDDLSNLLRDVQVYDRLLKAYQSQLEVYQTNLARVDEMSIEAEQWKQVQQAMLLVSQKVKQHLTPSLNRVASYFLQQMTGGERQTIAVDDSFDILVDGQGLHTLSGSGKAVANLALRLGLGQVLTNSVFSVFMGDEIDASMDANRAANTSATLQSLKHNISQIILVTHKFPEADYYIELGKSHARTNDSLSG